MEHELNELFNFLEQNRQYNKALQIRFYKSVIRPELNLREKVIALLHHVLYSQSQPKIDYAASFFKKIHENIEALDSYHDFVDMLSYGHLIIDNSLFSNLKEQRGWGDKTSALFVKTIYHLHNGQYPEELRLWDDVPNDIIDDDFYLPVDSVMIAIFKKIDPNVNWDFHKINDTIKKYYDGIEIEVWDDLWFWGFITQSGSGENRIHEWNENKYWAKLETDKDKAAIKKIKGLANEFLKIVESNMKEDYVLLRPESNEHKGSDK